MMSLAKHHAPFPSFVQSVFSSVESNPPRTVRSANVLSNYIENDPSKNKRAEKSLSSSSSGSASTLLNLTLNSNSESSPVTPNIGYLNSALISYFYKSFALLFPVFASTTALTISKTVPTISRTSNTKKTTPNHGATVAIRYLVNIAPTYYKTYFVIALA